MSKTLTFILLSILAFTLFACSDAAQPAPEPTEAAEAAVVETAVEPTVESSEEPAAEEAPEQADAEAEGMDDTAAEAVELYMPRDVQIMYDMGVRSPDGNPGPNYWQNHSVHNMSITVMPPDNTINATQEIVYTNNSPDPLTILGFRMYQNVRLPEAQREINVTEEFFNDGIIVNEFAINGEVTEWAPLESGTGTVKFISLPEQLLPGESFTFYFDWQYDLAEEENKEGIIEPTTFYLGYFYPRVAVIREEDGAVNWDMEEYTYRAGREMNNEFADFKFEVNVPPNFAVWATGDLLNPAEVLQPEYMTRLEGSFTSDEIIQIATPEEMQAGMVTAQDDTVTWQWQADNVLDIAIGISDTYFWDAGSVVVDPESGRRASVQAAYNAEATDFKEMVQYAKNALTYASTEWPGVPYPYSKMTGFRGDADEEYPMMFNDSSHGLPSLARFIAAHEILHSYFPFYMGINEQRYPMMDEGWTTAFEYLFNIDDQGQEWADDAFKEYRSGNLVAPKSGADIPILTPADSTRGFVTGRNAYDKSSLGYLAVKDIMGDEAFKEALHEFMDRWNGKHPLPWDTFNTFNDVYDENLNWFFQRWFAEPNYIDLRLDNVEVTDGVANVDITNVGGMPIPFDVIVSYADGSTETLHQKPTVWRDSADTITVTADADQEIEWVRLDGKIYPDAVETDNAWPEGILEELAMQALADSFIQLPAELTPGFSASAPESWTPSPVANGVNMLGDASGVPQLQLNVIADISAAELLEAAGVTNLEEALLETREANGLTWNIYSNSAGGIDYRYALAEQDGNVYAAILVGATGGVDALYDAVLITAVEGYVAGDA